MRPTGQKAATVATGKILRMSIKQRTYSSGVIVAVFEVHWFLVDWMFLIIAVEQAQQRVRAIEAYAVLRMIHEPAPASLCSSQEFWTFHTFSLLAKR